MGNKSGRTGKYILHYLAVSCIIAAVNFVACAPVQDKIAVVKAHQQLEQYREDMAAGFFETVIQQSKQVIAENETEPPADVAFYSLGEVYAHHDYKCRDYALSQYYFEKLIMNFPDSQLTSEAKTYISLFENIAAKEKEAAAAEEKVLSQTKIIVEKKKKLPVADPRKVVENQNFEEAVQENLQILEKAGKKKPADEALYNLGLIYAHIDNPAKDYKKSQTYFHVLTQEFPDSELAEEGRIWLGLFETIEKIQQIDVDIEQQKKQLSR
ncbi:MAG: tetratricopeptide repeat protein [Cyclobacteriaceae bacterium]|nr:tetratricopeptide repeat protein [Cyclobacteriaceae bacterium]